jgi:hypothetical protein
MRLEVHSRALAFPNRLPTVETVAYSRASLWDHVGASMRGNNNNNNSEFTGNKLK